MVIHRTARELRGICVTIVRARNRFSTRCVWRTPSMNRDDGTCTTGLACSAFLAIIVCLFAAVPVNVAAAQTSPHPASNRPTTSRSVPSGLPQSLRRLRSQGAARPDATKPAIPGDRADLQAIWRERSASELARSLREDHVLVSRQEGQRVTLKPLNAPARSLHRIVINPVGPRPAVERRVVVIGTLRPSPHKVKPMLNGSCPTTEADIIDLLDNYQDSQLSCQSPTTITFTTPIELSSARQLDASQSVAPITFDGGHTTGQTNGSQFFTVDSTGSLELDGLTLQNGYAASGQNGGAIFGYNVTLNGCTLLNNSDATPDGGGGAIVSDGDLNVINTTLSNNSLDGVGGAIAVFGGTATITASTFSNNSATTINDADGVGGAIFVFQGSANISGSTFTGNSAPSASGGGGGALALFNDTSATVSGSTFSDNSSGSTNNSGGAVSSQLASLSVTDSDLTNNSSSASSSGAIELLGGTTTIAGSTFSGNTASGGGGAISGANPKGYSGATLTLTGSTLVGNSAGGNSPGGALLTADGISATVSNDTFVGNAADGGGAIANGQSATLTLTNSTLSDNNSPNFDGGGIYNSDATRAPPARSLWVAVTAR